MTIRVVLVDDSEPFREGFAMLLRSLDGIELVAQAGSAEDGLLTAARTQPDVVVMDLHLPGTNGIEATARILATSPHIRVLVLTMLDDDASVVGAMRAGASGYLVKGAGQAEIVRAIEAVAAGEAIFGPAAARHVLTQLTAPSAEQPFPELSRREREVLELLAEGNDNAGIASSLGLTAKTVRNHLSTVFSKLGVTDRGQAIVVAREAGVGRGW